MGTLTMHELFQTDIWKKQTKIFPTFFPQLPGPGIHENRNITKYTVLEGWFQSVFKTKVGNIHDCTQNQSAENYGYRLKGFRFHFGIFSIPVLGGIL